MGFLNFFEAKYAKRLSLESTVVNFASDFLQLREIDNLPKSGELQVSSLYNFDIQPAMARPISSGESS